MIRMSIFSLLASSVAETPHHPHCVAAPAHDHVDFQFPISWSIVEAGIASRKPQHPNRRREFLRLDDECVVAAVVCFGGALGANRTTVPPTQTQNVNLECQIAYGKSVRHTTCSKE